MRTPPDFVIYVVMVKVPKSRDCCSSGQFNPHCSDWAYSQNGRYAKGWAKKKDADRECRELRVRYGKKNAYVQQYGPYS